MSNFYTAVQTVLKHEGHYVNDKDDAGGATNWGISLRFLKSLGDLEGDFDHDGDLDSSDIRVMTVDEAINLYKIHWWDKYQYDRIINQAVATKVLDLAVNMGSRAAHICLQRAIRACTGEPLLEDGILGDKSFQAINNAMPIALMPVLRSEAAGFYRSLNKPKYINGWLERAYDI